MKYSYVDIHLTNWSVTRIRNMISAGQHVDIRETNNMGLMAMEWGIFLIYRKLLNNLN